MDAASSLQLKLARLRRAAVISLLALIVLSLLWERWLAPIRPGGSWLMLKAVPLLLPLRGLLNGKRYTYQWSSLLILAYLTEGLVRATSDTGTSQWLAVIETALSSLYFVSVLMFCYDTRPSLTNPELKHARKKRR
ncbi:MAG: Putative transmembrane protein [Fluviibacter phosphoraccumulans EoVTN8]